MARREPKGGRVVRRLIQCSGFQTFAAPIKMAACGEEKKAGQKNIVELGHSS